MKIPQAPIREPFDISSVAWVNYFSQLTLYLGSLPSSNVALSDYVNDAAASAGGVPLYGFYRNGSVIMQRVV